MFSKKEEPVMSQLCVMSQEETPKNILHAKIKCILLI